MALNHDGSLLFFSDVLEKTTLPPIRLRDSSGVPYTVLSAQGHVFVLTSDEFIVFPDLAARVLRAERMDQPPDARVMPVHAVDAFLCGDDRVLLIEEERAGEFGFPISFRMPPSTGQTQGLTLYVSDRRRFRGNRFSSRLPPEWHLPHIHAFG